MTPLITLPHIALVLVAAFLIGVRAYRETQPKNAVVDEGNADSAQLLKFAKIAGIALVLLTLAVVIGLDMNFFHTAKAIQ